MKTTTTKQINVTLEQARDWYNSNNETLHELALSVYSENELLDTFEHTISNVVKDSVKFTIPCDKRRKIEAIMDLQLLASHYNDGWVKSINEIGFYIYKCGTNYCAFRHSLTTAGTIYFKDYSSAKRAIDVLGKERLDAIFS